MLRRAVPIIVAAGLISTTAIRATNVSQPLGRAAVSASLDGKLSAAITRGDAPGLVVMADTCDATYRIDPEVGVMMQYLPFADTKALGVYDTFERGVYQLVDAS